MFAAKDGIETIDFTSYSDIPKRIYDLVPEGLDVAIDAGRFRTPSGVHTLHGGHMFTLVHRNFP